MGKSNNKSSKGNNAKRANDESAMEGGGKGALKVHKAQCSTSKDLKASNLKDKKKFVQEQNKDNHKIQRMKKSNPATSTTTTTTTTTATTTKQQNMSEKLKQTPPSSLKENGKTCRANASGGIDEIENLFASAAKAKKEAAQNDQNSKHSKHFKQNQNTSSRQNPMKIQCHYNRNDILQLQQQQQSSNVNGGGGGAWASDGLGGVFNADGYTGRREADSGYRIYKAHLFNKKGFGNTKDCPFDCQCCFI